MKEAFELIKERLDEKKDNLAHNSELYREHGNERQVLICESEIEAFTKALSIVSEVEAEFGKDINVVSNKSTKHINKLNNWVDVKDRLPEDGQPIIATFTDGSVYQANFKLFLHKNPQYAHGHNVIAWMPLPEPYKPEKGV